MKKIAVFLFVVLFPIVGLAAGTVTETIDYNQQDAFGHVVILKYAITADASAGTVPDTTIYLQTTDDSSTWKMVDLNGMYIYGVKTVPGSGGDQPDAYTVDIQDEDSFSVIDISNRSQSAVEWFLGSTTLGAFPVIHENMTLVVGNLGISNTTTIYVYLVSTY